MNDLAAIIPESLNEPGRFALTAERHLNAITWKRQDYIPLGIIVNNPDHSKGISYGQWLDAGVFYELQAKCLRDTLIVGSDYMPVLPMNHTGDVLIPTMFGAELLVPETMAKTLQDQGATPRPVLDSIGQVDELELPDMTAGLMPTFEKIAAAWREWTPGWVDIRAYFPTGPFTLAAELRGGDFFTDLLDDPARSRQLLAMSAEMQVRVERHLQEVVGQIDRPPVSNFGVRGQGMRLGDDTIISLSPRMLTKFAVPYIRQVARELGPATVHFCTLPDRRVEHVFEPLADSPDVSMASSQFGFEYYEKHVDRLEGRLAVESFYGDALSYVIDRYGSFEEWARDFVPRYKERSGLVLYTTVASVEEGNSIWEAWQAAHGS